MSPDDMVQCSRELLDIGTDKMTTITMPGNPKTIGGGSYVVVEQEEFLNVREQSFGYDRSGNEIKK